jgi:phycocyanobilin lyase subunit beta
MSSVTLVDTLIAAVDAADSSQKLIDAVTNLAQTGLQAAAPKLIAALNYNNPGVAVAAVEGLIQIGKPAVPQLLELLDDYNYGARAWALRALSGIGDPRAFDLLLETAKNDFALSVRRAAARGLGCLQWEDMPSERRHDAQSAAMDALILVCQDPEWVVRYAAVVGLESLALTAQRADITTHVSSAFQTLAATESEIAIRARIWKAQQSLNPGLEFSWTATPSAPVQAEDSWSSTLERLYHRKSQERLEEQPLNEGDPRRFRQLAISLVQSGI